MIFYRLYIEGDLVYIRLIEARPIIGGEALNLSCQDPNAQTSLSVCTCVCHHIMVIGMSFTAVGSFANSEGKPKLSSITQCVASVSSALSSGP